MSFNTHFVKAQYLCIILPKKEKITGAYTALLLCKSNKTAFERKHKMNGEKELFEDQTVYTKIATASCKGLGETAVKSVRRAAAKVRCDFRAIRKIYGELCTDNARSGLSEWLSDNFYLIENEYEVCINALSSSEKVPFCNKDARMSAVFERFCFYADFPLDKDGIHAVISAFDRECDALLSELFFSPFFARIALMSLCRRLLEEYIRERHGSSFSEENYTRTFSDIITSLKYVSVHNFDKDILDCRCARMLYRDPSGAFGLMTEDSRMMYLRMLSRKAAKHGTDEKTFAAHLLKKAQQGTDERTRHIGCELMKLSKVNKYLYFISVLGIPLILTAALTFLSPLFLFAFLPLWEASVMISDHIFSRLCDTHPLPKMELTKIPENSCVLVVITSLLCGEKDDSELFDRLERIYCANGEKNVYFGILADIRDSKTAKAPGDEETINYAYGRIDALCSKHGKKFMLFERRRSYSKSEETFMGWERKRGAVTELVKYLRGDSTTFTDRSVALCSDVLKDTDIKYVVTLDADTDLGLDAVRLMCSAMLHPLAKPYVDKDKGIVTAGCGIMQPRCVPGIRAAGATIFSGIMCGEGGSNIYSGAAFDAYQSIFGEGIFCGKGIFDVDAFYEVIVRRNTFPDDLILSHDSVEGAKLGSALLSDIELTDGFPKNQISYTERLHRWIRGDMANLAYLFPKISFPGKEKRKNNISLLSKYKLFANAMRASVPIFAFAGVFCAMATRGAVSYLLLAASLFYIAVPFLKSIVSDFFVILHPGKTRRFFAKGVTTGQMQSFFGMLFTLSMLPTLALTCADAIFRALYRMFVSKKKLLEWKTSAASEKNLGGLLEYVHRNMICIFAGFLLLVFSPAGILRFIALLWFAFPVTAYHTSMSHNVGASGTRKEDIYIEKARKYAYDIWGFFKDNVTENDNHLPPDNISLAPREAVAHRTSPTNIGLYLLSVLCAADMGFITVSELEERLRNTLSTLMRMRRYKGHFYNWYDTESLRVLSPSYISTVDSGNLTACLITLRMGLRDHVSESTSLLEVIKTVQELEEETDYSFLYDNERELYALGAQIHPDGKAEISPNRYDLMMSEARTISYIQCAKRNVPKKHWTSLSRSLISSDGYIGLASWTGTAFEYFMPHIFLPLCRRSLCGEAMHFALHEQIKRRAQRHGLSIFGISESGYYAFDAGMSYRYRAFGIPSLALKDGQEKDLVISPYSTFLALCTSKKRAFANLAAMEKAGLYGKYGFYEAVDMTDGRCAKNGSVVKSYMSHHLGMSMCALCNTALDNILQRRFMSDCTMNCASELLEERIPVSAVIRKVRKKRYVPQKPAFFPSDGKIYTNPDICAPRTAMLSNGNSRIILSDTGHTELWSGDILVNHTNFDLFETTDSLFCFASFADKTISAGMLPGADDGNTEHFLKCNPGYACYVSRVAGVCEFSESLTMYRAESTVFSIKLELCSKMRKKEKDEPTPKFAVYFTPVIAKKLDYLSHVSFSSLFVSCEILRDNIILYKRRSSDGEDKAIYLAVALADSDIRYNLVSRADDLFSTPMSTESFNEIFRKSNEDDNFGALIRPCFAITFTPKTDGNLYGAEILLCVAAEKDKAISSVMAAREKSFREKCMSLSEISDKFSSNAGTGYFGSENNPSCFEKLLCGMVFGGFGNSCNQNCTPVHYGLGCLWKHGISGDFPIILLKLVSINLAGRLEKYIRALKLLRLCGLKADLCILYSEKEKYSMPVRREICGIISECDCSELTDSKNGGIFLIDKTENTDSAKALEAVACFKTDILYDESSALHTSLPSRIKLPVISPVLSADMPVGKESVLSLGCGSFTSEGFVVRKDREFKVPFTHILCGRRASALVTHNSLGYTWVSNAQSRRITPFTDDPLRDMNGERLLLGYAGELRDLCSASRYVTFSEGCARYDGYASGIRYRIDVRMSEKLSVKYVDVALEFPKGSTASAELMYLVTPIMGRHKFEERYVSYFEKDGILCFKNQFSEMFGKYTGFITVLPCDGNTDIRYITSKAEIFTDKKSGNERNDCACVCVSASPAESYSCRFILGAYRDSMVTPERIKRCAVSHDGAEGLAKAFAESLIPNIKITPSKDSDIQKAFSVLLNRFLPYQNAFGRFIGRSGFYQSSGAYGFRDQLQDCLCLMYSSANMVKAHIFRCCSRQFPEGDVLHWWHECDKSSQNGIVCKGVRTLCSDDYLWLPFVVSEFFRYSGDREFLMTRIHFAKGEELSGSDVYLREKYMDIYKSEESDTVYGHCIRAVDRAVSRLGRYGLPLIGSCDWCDGYSTVGNFSDGESVWLAMFLCMVLEGFSAICKKMSDTDLCERFEKARLSLISAIEEHGYSEKDGQYIRAYFADGDILGSMDSEECKIDLLPQCFAPMALKLPNERIYSLAKNSFERLFDRDVAIYKLFAPPFENSKQKPGYIKGYVPGIRENGGQYTHAAVWGAMGLCISADILYRNGEYAKASEVRSMAKKAIRALNPVLRHMGYLGKSAKVAYRAEPYWLSGDIYSNKDHKGRAGWTMYTGSASWYYLLLLKNVFGVNLYDTCTENPKLDIVCDVPFADSDICVGAILTVIQGDCRYNLEFSEGEKPSLSLDGENVLGRIRMEKGEHSIKVVRPRGM